MTDNIRIHGFGTTETPFIERPPLPCAQFRLPPDAYMATTTVTSEYVELRIRVPLATQDPDMFETAGKLDD